MKILNEEDDGDGHSKKEQEKENVRRKDGMKSQSLFGIQTYGTLRYLCVGFDALHSS